MLASLKSSRFQYTTDQLRDARMRLVLIVRHGFYRVPNSTLHTSSVIPHRHRLPTDSNTDY